jgi:hypothetical protein
VNESRRDFMKKAAVGTGVVWSVPVITSFAAPAAAAGTPPPGHGTTTTTSTTAPVPPVSPTTTLPGGGPHTADDCKKGGWQRYGVFRNQGDCVSWVATHGKNEPGKNQPGH